MSLVTGTDDAARVRELRRMKAWPLALLITAAVVYVAARRLEALPDAWAGWSYVRAAAEAGVVGGLADWFAVTALFRHPLGLPIPHTALIPRKKDQLGLALSTFVRGNFLRADTVADKVLRIEPGRRLGGYLADDAHRARVVAEASDLAVTALAGVRDDEVQLLVRNTLFSYAAATALSPVAGTVLAAAVADRTHTGLVDVTLDSTHRWLLDNRDPLIDLIASQGPVSQTGPIRWMHEQVAVRLFEHLVQWVHDVRHDGDHEARAALDRALLRYADDLRHDPRTIERVEGWKLDILQHPQTQAAVSELWPTLRRLLTEALTDPASDLRQRVDRFIADIAGRLRTDEAFRAAFDERVRVAVEFLVERYGDDAVSVISDTVARWDGAEASRRIELAVGRDLQYIRINGTVVVALAGLAIHAASGLVV